MLFLTKSGNCPEKISFNFWYYLFPGWIPIKPNPPGLNRTVCYQQRERQQAHLLGKTQPCTLCDYGIRTTMALLLTNDEEAILSKLFVFRRSISNAKKVGQQCVEQPEELRSEDQIT